MTPERKQLLSAYLNEYREELLERKRTSALDTVAYEYEEVAEACSMVMDRLYLDSQPTP